MGTKIAQLRQVAKIYAGVSIKAGSGSFGAQGCPWVMVENLNDTYVEETSRKLSEEGRARARISPPGTVFFSRTGTVGKVGLSVGEMAPSNNIFALEFDRNYVEPLYGMYCLIAYRREFQAEAKGAVYTSLALDVFRNFMIPVPELPVQRKIAEKLEALCQAKRVQARLLQTVRKTIHSMFDSAFAEEIEGLKGKDGSLHLEDCAELLFTGAAKRELQGGERVRYISTGLLDDWAIPCDQAPAIELEPGMAKRFLLEPGDIVMNRINQPEGLGRCGYVRPFSGADEPAVFGLNTVRIRARSAMADPAFLFAWLTHPLMKHYIQQKSKNSTSFQSSLLKAAFLEIPVPAAGLKRQKEFSKKLEKCFLYTEKAARQMETLEALQQVWYGRIRLLGEEAVQRLKEAGEEPAAGGPIRCWTTPGGVDCFYDAYLECLQIPGTERAGLKAAQLPMGVEIQFLDGIRDVSQSSFGSLEHIRLYRANDRTLRVTWMKPVAYQSGQKEGTEELAEPRESAGGGLEPAEARARRQELDQIEENGLVSEQQDFGYLRYSREYELGGAEEVDSFLKRPAPYSGEVYGRFGRLPQGARQFISRLSPFQQAVYEEFLLAMQPLACHMAGKHLAARAGREGILGHGIQDVTATVKLLEHAGLLERRQGFYLSYYKEYRQGEERELILDHRGRPIPMDTWVWAEPEE